ncbi:MAG: hypothetical protein R2707_15845 [Acidimicrobiales bacterium]
MTRRTAAVAVALALLAAACGDDATAPPDDLEAPAEPVSCDSFGAARALTEVGITYDYEPSDSMADLAAASRVVVRGRIAWISAGDAEGSDVVVLSVEVDELALDRRGDQAVEQITAGEIMSIVVSYNPSHVGFGTIRDAIELGTGVVAFLGPVTPDGFRRPHLEGLWLGCGEEGAHHAGIAPSWDSGSTSLAAVLETLDAVA